MAGTRRRLITRLALVAVAAVGVVALWVLVSINSDRPVTYDSEDFVVVAESDRTSRLAFQRATGHRPPTWPSPETPQQMHLDVMVEDPTAARTHVLRLGATHLDGDVYADPAGHPFCLIRRPHWADELS